MPPAPGLFSTITGLPSRSCMASARMRPIMSAPPARRRGGRRRAPTSVWSWTGPPAWSFRRHRFGPHAARPDALEDADDAARHEDDAQNEQNAVDGIGSADEIGAEGDAQAFVERDRQERADGRAEHRIHAADDGGK